MEIAESALICDVCQPCVCVCMRVLAVGLSNPGMQGSWASVPTFDPRLKDPVVGERGKEYQLAVILADVLLCRRLAGAHVQSYDVGRKMIASFESDFE